MSGAERYRSGHGAVGWIDPAVHLISLCSQVKLFGQVRFNSLDRIRNDGIAMKIAQLTVRAVVLLAFCPSIAQGEDGSPPQYVVSIAQGVSRSEAQMLLSVRGSRTQSTTSLRSGSRRSTLRVTSGVPARVATGEMLYAIDRVYVAHWGNRSRHESGLGVERSEKPVTRGFSITATQHGEFVDVKVDPSLRARVGRIQRIARSRRCRPSSS